METSSWKYFVVNRTTFDTRELSTIILNSTFPKITSLFYTLFCYKFYPMIPCSQFSLGSLMFKVAGKTDTVEHNLMYLVAV